MICSEEATVEADKNNKEPQPELDYYDETSV